LATIDTGRKDTGAAVSLLGEVTREELGSISHNVAKAGVYLHTKWHLDPTSHLATINMGRKVASLCPFLGI